MAAALIVVSQSVAFLSGGIALINGVVWVVAFFLLLLGLDEVRATDCLPGIVETANANRRKGGAA